MAELTPSSKSYQENPPPKPYPVIAPCTLMPVGNMLPPGSGLLKMVNLPETFCTKPFTEPSALAEQSSGDLSGVVNGGWRRIGAVWNMERNIKIDRMIAVLN